MTEFIGQTLLTIERFRIVFIFKFLLFITDVLSKIQYKYY